MMELLRLCGYEAQEIESELPRVKKAFNKLGITAQDIERAKQRLNKYYGVELKGVRKILRLCIQELVNWTLAKEEGKTKFIYSFMATGFFDTIAYAVLSKSKEVYVGSLNSLHHTVLGSIFEKIVPILEAAEKRWLKAGAVAHCGNVKTTVGLIALDVIPKPDLLVNSGVLCETAPKTIDLLHELYGIPPFCYDTCQDRDIREYPEATKRIADLLLKSSRRLTRRIEEIVGFEITDDMVREANEARRQLGKAIDAVQNLVSGSDPLVISANHQSLWTQLLFLPMGKDRLPEALDAINTLYEELQERVNNGVGVVEKGAPRIVAILPSHYTDPSLDYMVGEMGMALVSTDMSFPISDVGDLKDSYEKLSVDGVQTSIHNSLARRVTSITEGCKKLKVDGVMDRFHIGCRTVTADALMIKDAITKELGIPVLLVERDDFDPRVCNHQQYQKSLEVFRAMLTGSRQNK
ncbi:MAG TPA: 2-hydroxyacyl-CoA dehydratase [Dehalococcoidia bacterium]|nr:2-hydroxyacyl-CoA dehydratase [Dehalococcoidia bacterium]